MTNKEKEKLANLINSAQKIQTWIHTHPRKATICNDVVAEFDKAIRLASEPSKED